MDPKLARGLVDSAGQKSPVPVDAQPLRGLVPASEAPVFEQAAKAAADLNQGERRKLAKEGKALSDGSFPIRNVDDLKKARVRAHQGGHPAAAMRLIKKRERELGVDLGPIGG